MPSVDFNKTTLIRDRTQADVDQLLSIKNKTLQVGISGLTNAERTFIRNNQKGALNHLDLNRWGNAMNAVSTVINTYGYSLPTNNKTDWSRGVYPTSSLISTIVTNLNAINTAVGSLFLEQTSYSVVYGGGYSAIVASVPFDYAVMAEPSWASLSVTPLDISTLDYSTIYDWNNIEQFLYEVIAFLEDLP